MYKLGFSMVIPHFISLKFKSTLNCPYTKCPALTMKHNPGVIRQAVITEK